MPIHLTTGLPGSGKTLRSLVYIKELAEREGRTVYYHGINELKLSWQPLENPKEWNSLPEGSIIVIDECQDLYPVHETKLAAEPHVLMLAKHRHRGYDIFLISQHPMNIHAFVRRLIDKHWHIIRAFGMKGSTVHEWNRVIDYPEKTKKDSQTSIFNYPKDAFNYYKSAEVHTIQRKIPKKVYWLIVVLLLVPTFLFFAFTKLSPDANRKRIEALDSTIATAPAGTSQNGLIERVKQKVDLTYVEAHTAELLDFPHTAPAFKEITKPTQAPYPAACVAMGNLCKCYTQQGTKLQTTDAVCHQIVENGFFLEWKQEDSPGATTVSNNNQVYPARDVDRNFAPSIGDTSRASPSNSPST